MPACKTLMGMPPSAKLEFRLKVVREVLNTDCPHSHAAKRHGISAAAVGQWVRRYLVTPRRQAERRRWRHVET